MCIWIPLVSGSERVVPQANSVSIGWELVKNRNNWALPQTYWAQKSTAGRAQKSVWTSPPGDTSCGAGSLWEPRVIGGSLFWTLGCFFTYHCPLPTIRAADAANRLSHLHPSSPHPSVWLFWVPQSASCLHTVLSSPCTFAMIFACFPLEHWQQLPPWALSWQLMLLFYLPSQVRLHCHLYLWGLDKDTGKRILSRWVHLHARSLELARF